MSDKIKSRHRRLTIVDQPGIQTERRDAAENRTRILETARTLLKERPIHAICMDELARAANVGKGTLYRRFEDRASLCRALLHEDAMKLQEDVLAGLGLPLSTPWIERAETFVCRLFDFVYTNAALLSEALAYDRGPDRFQHPAHTWKRDSLALYLAKAVQAKEIPPLEPELTAEFVLSSLDPDLMQWHQNAGRNHEELKTSFLRCWRLGVGSCGPKHST